MVPNRSTKRSASSACTYSCVNSIQAGHSNRAQLRRCGRLEGQQSRPRSWCNCVAYIRNCLQAAVPHASVACAGPRQTLFLICLMPACGRCLLLHASCDTRASFGAGSIALALLFAIDPTGWPLGKSPRDHEAMKPVVGFHTPRQDHASLRGLCGITRNRCSHGINGIAGAGSCCTPDRLVSPGNHAGV